MINYMEYWTGTELSDSLTQHDDSERGSSDEIEIIDRPAKICKRNKSDVLYTSSTTMNEEELIAMLQNYIKSMTDANTLEIFRQKLAFILQETKARALSIRSIPLGEQELTDEIWEYVMSIDHDEALKKEWVLSLKPYPIALTLKKIQEILKKDKSMDPDCFNLAVRHLACQELHMLKATNKIVSKHYMDLKFCDACAFSRGLMYRVKVDAQQLAKLVLSWPWRKYDVSKCRLVHIPCFNFLTAKFMLYGLDLKTRVVSIYDPAPIDPGFEQHPLRKYTQKIQRLSSVLKMVMNIACMGWNENVYLWDHVIPNGVQVNTNSEMSGYYLLLFMSAWDGERIQTPFCTDAYELRKRFLVHLLTYKENQYEHNIPEVLRYYLRRYINLTNGKA
ncbi:hypothetical protein GQ55_1G291200 [Panicum hallii var. hallii]|uniref:Ubiquitin-like protease family profile domain-containing protein n=1 Tax=Panicum hallii var. hallii TaxID=1504633 RepID=A0A2T7F8M6_9POAL|nr:hypothetical protein GQ55_1G291200 [Panicum hallii var. hallii]